MSVEIEERKLRRVLSELEEARGEWIDEVLVAVGRLPHGHEFIADELFDRVSECPGDARAMGAALRRAASLGLVENTGRFQKSGRVGCHANLIAVWRRTDAA